MNGNSLIFVKALNSGVIFHKSIEYDRPGERSPE